MGPTIGAHARGLADATDTSGYLRFLRAFIAAVDAAMAAEGVDPDVRDRVVERVYGMPALDEPTPVRPDGPPVNAPGW
jgi:hypothetical protein